MPCTGAFATPTDYAAMFCLENPLSADETAMVETILDIAAADIHAAMAANDQCGCALAPWATMLLVKLNCIDAACVYNCRCGGARLTDEQRQLWLGWMNDQLTAIRLGQIELCAGETGSEFPARASAEINWTDWSEAEIIWKAQQRALVP